MYNIWHRIEATSVLSSFNTNNCEQGEVRVSEPNTVAAVYHFLFTTPGIKVICNKYKC